MARAVRRSRPQQPTLLFRLIFAGAFLALSSNQIAHQGRDIGGDIRLAGTDPMVTGAIIPGGLIRAAQKADRLPLPHQPANPFHAGYVEAPPLFAPAAVQASGRSFTLPPAISVALKVEVPVEKKVVAVARLKPKPTPIPAAPPAAEPEPVLLTYAPAKDTAAAKAPFEAVIAKAKPLGSVVVPNIGANHAWVNDPLPASIKSEKETRCLAEAIYFEARSEPERGQMAVAQVVLNRVKNPAYPDTICTVVYQNKNKRHRCQFSFACDGIRDRISDKRSWDTSLALAKRIVADDTGLFLADIDASTHYHATYVRPRWASKMKKMEKIGRHVFYKTYGGGWS